MQVRVASYNIRKAIGTDRRRDPERILAVLAELEADIVFLQEADKRVGTRGAAVPHSLIERQGLFDVAPAEREHAKLLDLVPDHDMTRGILDALDTRNLGWHGNAILVRKGVEIEAAACVDLPSLEPRGAMLADVAVGGVKLRLVGCHLDLSGLYRRQQAEALCALAEEGRTTIVAGDMNEWRPAPNTLDPLRKLFRPARCGPSYHTRKPMARLDRIFCDRRAEVVESGVHRSAFAKEASDHYPVWALLEV